MQIIYEEGELSEDQVREMLREKAVEVGGQDKLASLVGMHEVHISQTLMGRRCVGQGNTVPTRINKKLLSLLGLRKEKKIIYAFSKEG